VTANTKSNNRRARDDGSNEVVRKLFEVHLKSSRKQRETQNLEKSRKERHPRKEKRSSVQIKTPKYASRGKSALRRIKKPKISEAPGER